jgi:hypothetical protein
VLRNQVMHGKNIEPENRVLLEPWLKCYMVGVHIGKLLCMNLLCSQEIDEKLNEN